MYSPVRVSILIKSPMSTNDGQANSAPVSTLQGLVTFVAVLPRPGLAVFDLQHHVVGRRDQIGRPLNSTMLQIMPSLRYFQASSTCSAVNSYCS